MQIIIADWTEYDPEKCNNGGCYAYWTILTLKRKNKWTVKYETSADIEFCQSCGDFHRYCGRPLRRVDDKYVSDVVNYAIDHDNMDIKFS